MLNIHELIIDEFSEALDQSYRQLYGRLDDDYLSVAQWACRMAVEVISNTDTLYHNVEHTLMVASAGTTILKGRHIFEGGVMPIDWLHYMTAALCHDIGYVRGACRLDDGEIVATGKGDETVIIDPNLSDAHLGPYHVDRSMTFVRERFSNKILVDLDPEAIASYIDMTRFPIPDEERYRDTAGWGGLLRAADLIGQLGDPKYIQKIPALYYEFHEQGALDKLGYETPGEVRKKFAAFYWKAVRPYVNDAIRFMRLTDEGRRWIASLHAHVFHVEHDDW